MTLLPLKNASNLERGMTQKLLREVLCYDSETGVFRWRVSPSHRAPVGSLAGTRHPSGYRRIIFCGRRYYAHRLAWLYVYGHPPKMNVDHINGIRNDNRIRNLRVVTQSQNCGNARLSAANTSGFKGVVWDKSRKKWAVRIKVNYKTIHLGRFDDINEAAKIAKAAREKYFPV